MSLPKIDTTKFTFGRDRGSSYCHILLRTPAAALCGKRTASQFGWDRGPFGYKARVCPRCHAVYQQQQQQGPQNPNPSQ